MKCAKCGKYFDPQDEPGGILFSAPDTINNGTDVQKYHICRECVRKIIDSFKEE